MKSKAVPKVVSDAAFRKAIEKFRIKEKKYTRERDRLNAERRRLPAVEIAENFVFEGPNGKESLLDLFEGRNQLLLYHFMYHPKTDTFCKGCSFIADHIPHLSHINARDTSFAMVSWAPLKSIKRHKKRMGWNHRWVSSWNNSFNEFLQIDGDNFPALSVFLRDGKKIYRTYFTTARGLEYLGTPFAFLDVTAWGRQETWEKSPRGWPQTPPYEWWRMHDEY